ncbi:MAG: hypothetical protein AAGD22_15480 [Verrucomicrobiota bacterium]
MFFRLAEASLADGGKGGLVGDRAAEKLMLQFILCIAQALRNVYGSHFGAIKIAEGSPNRLQFSKFNFQFRGGA